MEDSVIRIPMNTMGSAVVWRCRLCRGEGYRVRLGLEGCEDPAPAAPHHGACTSLVHWRGHFVKQMAAPLYSCFADLQSKSYEAARMAWKAHCSRKHAAAYIKFPLPFWQWPCRARFWGAWVSHAASYIGSFQPISFLPHVFCCRVAAA